MKEKGFTLIEVMVAVAIVSVSLVSIYSAFMGISDTLARMDNYNRSVLLGLEKMWELEEAMLVSSETRVSDFSGPRGERFTCEFKENELESYPNLREVNLTIQWKQGKRSGSFQAGTYLRTKAND